MPLVLRLPAANLVASSAAPKCARLLAVFLPSVLDSRRFSDPKRAHRWGVLWGWPSPTATTRTGTTSRPSPTFYASLMLIFKTAYYSIYLPVAASAASPSPASPAALPRPQSPSSGRVRPRAEYAHVLDDFLDYAVGKIGTDVVDNKRSWYANAAVALTTLTQRAVLDANCGRKDPV
ncbi:uncharacterized protein BXZ73DRAFT_108303 [Epithele typhae]|uniref:uncharacterized protein n=1 Tax=Epithele typhae TaxID=378194 RepID=UPI00200821A8|nr:uncharacterized protein BXZ73DRAFT_108303 [Epithele typhae]KAH9911024.1 hypothetical protein BXZ73DRAFT_108303 [Epithele typhae]